MMIDDPSEEDEKINHLECVKVDENKHKDDDFENYALEHYDNDDDYLKRNHAIMPMSIFI